MSAAIDLRARRLELASRELAATSPQAVLARGFAVVTLAGDPGGARMAIRDASTIAMGEELEIRFAKGEAIAETLEVRK